MSLPLAGTIEVQIRRFVAGLIDIDDLENWTLMHAWNVHKLGNPRAERLTHLIQELALLVNGGTLSEDEARGVLADRIHDATPSDGESGK